MDIFTYDCYKELLKNTLQMRRKIRTEFTFEAMAKACNIQKTYLSKVLNHKGNLNLDQLYAASEFLRLKPLEDEYLLVLYHANISQHPKRKREFQKKLQELQANSMATEKNLNIPIHRKSQAVSELAEYYSDPYYSLIHMFLTIERYARQTQLICQDLNLSTPKMIHYLNRLESMGIIEQSLTTWRVLEKKLHLPESSTFVKAHRTLLRLKSIEQIEKLDASDFYSLTVTFSSELSVQKEIRKKFLQFLESVEKLVESGKEKEVYQLNFDLLKWNTNK